MWSSLRNLVHFVGLDPVKALAAVRSNDNGVSFPLMLGMSDGADQPLHMSVSVASGYCVIAAQCASVAQCTMASQVDCD